MSDLSDLVLSAPTLDAAVEILIEAGYDPPEARVAAATERREGGLIDRYEVDVSGDERPRLPD